jgi:hypothetical protein
MKRAFQLSAISLWFLTAAIPAWCQAPQPSSPNERAADAWVPAAYVQAGVVASLLPEGTPSTRVPYTVHGVVPGAVFGGGVRLSRAVALEVETILTRRYTSPLVFLGSSNNASFDGGVRDRMFGASLRMRPGRNRLEVQIGGGVALSRYSENLLRPEWDITRKQGMVGAGMSTAWRVGTATAVVPSLTYRWVNRPDEPSGSVTGGTSRHNVQLAVVVRR